MLEFVESDRSHHFRLRAFVAIVAALAFVLLTNACSSSSGGATASGGITAQGGSTASGGTTGGQCSYPAACNSCVQENCDSQAAAVYGAGYKNGNNSGGLCPNLLACACATSGQSGNMQTCAQQDGANCATAFGALDSCLSAAPCASACMVNNGNGGATASGGTMVVGGTTATGGENDAGVMDAPGPPSDASLDGSDGGGGTDGVAGIDTGGSSGIEGGSGAGDTTSGDGSPGAPPTLSQDQSAFESFTTSPNAAYQCYYSLPYQGTPVSGTNYFMASSAQLTTSPSTGARKGAQTGLVNIGKLPIPTGYAPFRYLVGGKIVASSEPVWIASVSYPAGAVEGISGGVQYDLFDTTGTIVVASHIRSGYSIVQLTGNVASNSFPDLVNYFSPLFYNATPLLDPRATWVAGASYEKFTATQLGDAYMVFDFSLTQTASGSTPKPVATGTTIAALMNAGGILVSTDGTTYTLALGSVSMINGVNTYVATSPRLSPKTTRGYATFYDLNGNVYFGELIRDGTVLGGNPYAAPGAYPTLTYTENYAIRLNEAAVTSFQSAVTF